jgi:hypothetical protein
MFLQIRISFSTKLRHLDTVLRICIADPKHAFHSDADPDPTFSSDADPDPTFHFEADPDAAFYADP